MLLMRLAPIFPLNLFNYGIALTKVSDFNYFWGSFGVIPKRAMLIYFALSISNIADVLSGKVEYGPFQYFLWAFSSVIVVMFTIYLYKLTKREIERIKAEQKAEEEKTRA